MILQTAKIATKLFTIAMLLFFISGCKVAIYHNLNEQDANKMMALLLNNKISVSKVMDNKGIIANLMVEESQVITALDILHNNGYPRNKFISINEIFPPGQLITSPEQQRVKMVYAEEQQIDSMLSYIPGVISAHTQINEQQTSDITALNNKETPPSAAVLIIYSPRQNMNNYLLQIRSLIKNSLPGLTEENLSVVLIPNKYIVIPHTP